MMEKWTVQDRYHNKIYLTEECWQPLVTLVESWRETAELLADPEHRAAVAEARTQYQAGDVYRP